MANSSVQHTQNRQVQPQKGSITVENLGSQPGELQVTIFVLIKLARTELTAYIVNPP